MRIVSLLPSATEIVCALGLRDQLVGMSHASDFPPEIEGVPIVTHAAAGRSCAGGETEPWSLDVEALLAARPDLVLMRDGAPGPAPRGPRQRDVRDVLRALDGEPTIVNLDPLSIEGIFHSITTIGAMSEAEDEAVGLLEVLREDLGALEEQAAVRHEAGIRPRRVVVLEALDPPYASGRWLPEQVRRAGGWELLGREGEAAAATSWEAILDVDPEMLVLAPSGLHLSAAVEEWRCAAKPALWHEIDAVKRGQVFVVEPVYFDRPGPRIVDGVAMLAEICDPDGFVETSPPSSWTPLFE